MQTSFENHPVLKSIGQESGISDELWAEFAQNLVIRRYKKGEVLQKSQATVKQCWIILEGLARIYSVDLDGDEVTIGLFEERGFACAYPSFLKDENTPDAIQVIENSVCAVFDLEFVQALARDHVPWNIFIRRLIESYLIALYERSYNLLHYSAAERFEVFRKSRPELCGRMSQKQIASYLGISREALNRLIKELS